MLQEGSNFMNVFILILQRKLSNTLVELSRRQAVGGWREFYSVLDFRCWRAAFFILQWIKIGVCLCIANGFLLIKKRLGHVQKKKVSAHIASNDVPRNLTIDFVTLKSHRIVGVLSRQAALAVTSYFQEFLFTLNSRQKLLPYWNVVCGTS